MSAKPVGVLVMSYGTPEHMDQVESYYTHIRRGRPPSPEQVQQLKARYEAIGGTFPLRQRTLDQVNALQKSLDRLAGRLGISFRCFQGLKHASPLIEEGVENMVKEGIEEAVGIVLAPHYSAMSVGGYIQRAEKAAAEKKIRITCVKEYHLHPLLIEAWAKRIREGLLQFEEEVRSQVHILFTAHSLPEKILKWNDPYPDQVLATAKSIMDRLKLANPWQLAWQSQGQTEEPWLGPELPEVLKTLKQKGVNHVLISPIGFVSDHLETLYDLDIEAQNVARSIGLELKRTPALNHDPLFIDVLTDRIIQAYKGVMAHDPS